MNLLRDHEWAPQYTPASGNLLDIFYIPALSCAVRYDRATGYFGAEALLVASKGVEQLVAHGGTMRLVCGCTLESGEIAAIRKGESLRETIDAHYLRNPFQTDKGSLRDALELLAWMVAKGILEIRLAVARHPDSGEILGENGLFHAKYGIIKDGNGDRIGFSGSINETLAGWTKNWDSFLLMTSWNNRAHVESMEATFQALWENREKTAVVMELGEALKEHLLNFAPQDNELPARLKKPDAPVPPAPPKVSEEYEKVWRYIRETPAKSPEGDMVGAATSAVTPWPHQLRAFRRMYDHWPPHLLIADEVGLGKTIQAGLIIRQAWLSGKGRRILILAPKAVLTQWQLELREKFNLNVPIYDNGTLRFATSPALRGKEIQGTSNTPWHAQNIVIASSHLMRRRERRREILEDAKPWDLVILDEAHHARRKNSAKGVDASTPNQLLRLMRDLKDKTKGLVLLTATPMQVHPIEVWDLLSLLGLPEEWSADNFLSFFEFAAKPAPTNAQMAQLAYLFRAMERQFGQVPDKLAMRMARNSRVTANAVLKALRDPSGLLLEMLSSEKTAFALRIMKAWSPTALLISRHTRELLRKYHSQGKLDTAIATREVQDLLVDLTPDERNVYEEVEDYISRTYNKAIADKRTAIGFVMTIYRRRLASSFLALTRTLKNRIDTVEHAFPDAHGQATLAQARLLELSEDLWDEDESNTIDAGGDALSEEDAAQLEKEALKTEEISSLRALLEMAGGLPADSKVKTLVGVLKALSEDGYHQVIIFTQYTDTLDFLRSELGHKLVPSDILCYSGRGGERFVQDHWEGISREKTKELFRKGEARVLLCTDAAAEGLNFQFCGALVNYDMPWNPMRVEQRIGRIDRVGQKYSTIRVVNLMYRDTVEADIYSALRERISLFSAVVGGLQPILSSIPQMFRDYVLQRKKKGQGQSVAKRVADKVTACQDAQKNSGFDLDDLTDEDLEMPDSIAPAYDLAFLHDILTRPEMLPPGHKAKTLGKKDFEYTSPDLPAPIRITTDAQFYEEHPESVELWSPGSPAFPWHEGGNQVS